GPELVPRGEAARLRHHLRSARLRLVPDDAAQGLRQPKRWRRLVRGESPSWSPTADVIAYWTETAGQLHLIRPDGSGDRQVGRYRTFAWSRDGTRFGVTLPCPNDPAICLVTRSVQTARVIRSTPAGYFHAGFAWS